MLILKISFHFRMQDFLAKPEFRDANWAQIMEHAKYLVTMDLARVNFEYDQVRNLIGLSPNYTMEDQQVSERENRQALGKHNYLMILNYHQQHSVKNCNIHSQQ